MLALSNGHDPLELSDLPLELTKFLSGEVCTNNINDLVIQSSEILLIPPLSLHGSLKELLCHLCLGDGYLSLVLEGPVE